MMKTALRDAVTPMGGRLSHRASRGLLDPA
jgi:hypothetical protein